MNKNQQEQRQVQERELLKQSFSNPKPQGWYSNQIITNRNGGVRHQFADDIGGCSANYR